MTRSAFEQEILNHLSLQYRRYPAMEQRDTVKFVFQAMLGVGHLLSGRAAVEERIAREMEPLPADPAEPLAEPLSPSWCRLNLRAAKARGITPAVIAGLMLSDGNPGQFTRQDVRGFCGRLAETGEYRITDPEELEKITDETWLPSHSPVYREKYRPAYRVIPAGWIPCLELVGRIAGQPGERVLVTIDGPCATGKTTLAMRLAGVFGGAVAHTDDYVIPHAQKTPERLAVPGGNCDADRLEAEIAAPWKRGETVVYRRYDCRNDRLLPEESMPDCRILILEGSYCNLPAIRKHADVRAFLEAPWETRKERLEQREPAWSLQRFHDLWIPLEDRYFEAYGLPDRECLVIRQGEQN